jgi:excinuclease ABC subunit C
MSITKSQLKSLPNYPGIYLFYNSRKELIYVGKATSLRSRVKSYFTSLLSFPRKRESRKEKLDSIFQRNDNVNRPIEAMIHEVKNIKTIKTASVLEAIILEGQYIKKYHPKYNIKDRDDKSWNYLYLTDDPFPKLKTIRQHETHNSLFIIHNNRFKN